MALRDDGDALLTGQFQPTQLVHSLHGIISAAMVTKQQRNAVLVGGVVEHFLGQELIPGGHVLAIGSLVVTETFLLMLHHVDAVGSNAVDDGIAVGQGIGRLIPLVVAVEGRGRIQVRL